MFPFMTVLVLAFTLFPVQIFSAFGIGNADDVQIDTQREIQIVILVPGVT